MATTIEEKIKKATKKSETLKADLDAAQVALDKATADYTNAEKLQEKNESKDSPKKVRNSLKDTNDKPIIQPLLRTISTMKKQVTDVRKLATESLTNVWNAKEASNKLLKHVQKVQKDEGDISDDLIADAPKANETISKAWDDALVAYNSSMGAIEGFLTLEQSLNKINEELGQVDSEENLGLIESTFGDMTNNSKTFAEDLKAVMEKKQGAFDGIEKKYNAIQDEISKLNEEQAVEESVNA